MLRNVPKVSIDHQKGYASLISKGFDTLVESFNVRFPDELIDRIEQAKQEAASRDKMKDALVTFSWGDRAMQTGPRGGSRAKYLVQCPEFSFSITPAREWGLIVEYSAAGLWQYGIDEMRRLVRELIVAECEPQPHRDVPQGSPLEAEHWTRLSRVDYAFDFHSETFTTEFGPEIWGRVVQHSSSKKRADPVKGVMYGRADYLETLTLGKAGRMQVQVYDKGKEITEISGKMWMQKVWEQEGYFPPKEKLFKDVWRLEVRFWSDFLRERQIRTYEEFCESAQLLITEALFTRRVATANSKDTNMRRRALHPLWSIAWLNCGMVSKMRPVGRVTSKSREAMIEVAKKQVFGCVRNIVILSGREVVDQPGLMEFARRAIDEGMFDPKFDIKNEKARERYSFYNRARA